MNLKIALLPGDGIGPEIITQAVKVVKAVASKFNHKIRFEEGLIGAISIDETGNPFPDETFELCKQSDAVLFGAIGDLKYDLDPKAIIRPEQGLLAMRKKLGLFANVRPIIAFPSLINKSPLRPELIDGTDFVVIRELTGGIYFGEPRGRSEDGNIAFDTCIYSGEEIKRILHLAFQFAEKRSGKLTVVDKANVLASSRLWREKTQELGKEYPDVDLDFMFVDNAAMQIIQNPKNFDVIVTENMFGDILTDEASVITGSLGLLPSASMGTLTSVFEPVHGSYPQATGKNIANPLGMILSVSLMFKYAFKLKEEAFIIQYAVDQSLQQGIVTVDIAKENPKSTSEVGDWIAGFIEKN
jgi:3-isopropylmalate dehydrogenase